MRQLPQNQLPLCNALDFLKTQIINKDTTKIIIPGGKFRTISQKQKRSLTHQGIEIALKEYNSRKLILQTLKTLKNITGLRNDTIYRNQILNGIIQNTEIYKIIEKGEHNLTLWRQKHPLIVRNRSIRLEQLNRMKEILKNEDN